MLSDSLSLIRPVLEALGIDWFLTLARMHMSSVILETLSFPTYPVSMVNSVSWS